MNKMNTLDRQKSPQIPPVAGILGRVTEHSLKTNKTQTVCAHGCTTSAALRGTRGIVIQLRTTRLASAAPRTHMPEFGRMMSLFIRREVLEI